MNLKLTDHDWHRLDKLAHAHNTHEIDSVDVGWLIQSLSDSWNDCNSLVNDLMYAQEQVKALGGYRNIIKLEHNGHAIDPTPNHELCLICQQPLSASEKAILDKVEG